MAYKDTLTLYDELVATGTPSEQAKIMAHQQGALSDEMGGRYNELNAKLDHSIQDLRKDLFWMRSIGAGMVAAYIANVGAIVALIVLMK